jgi:hypothetical protein
MPIFTQKKKKLFLTKYYSFLFIHIPRTSGSSVEDYFKKMGYSIKLLDRDYNTNKNKSFLKISPQHLYLNDVLSFSSSNNFTKIFTIVRNPIDRFISAYNFAKNCSLMDSSYTISSFIDHILDNTININFDFDRHFASQSDFIKNDLGINIDIFKFEELHEFYKYLHSFNSKKYPIEKTNSTTHLECNLKRTDKKRISEIYKDDFNNFGYNLY